MSLLNKLIKHVELSSLEEAAGGDEWWGSLSKPQRKAYVKKHPNSKYAKKMNDPYSGGDAKKSSKPEADKSSGIKVRGPAALKVKTPKSAAPEKKKSSKPVAEDKPVPKKKTKQKPVKKSSSTPKKSGRPSSVSPKEMAKRIQSRIKNLTNRIELLNAEKTYRNIARGFTKRDSTKERLNERIKKINEMIKSAQAKIKSKQKHLQSLLKK